MQNYMVYVRWKNKTQLPTAYNVTAKDLNNLRKRVIESKVLNNEKVDEVAVFKVSDKTKKQTHIGDMVKRQFVYSWVTMDKKGVPKWKDLRMDGTIWRD